MCGGRRRHAARTGGAAASKAGSQLAGENHAVIDGELTARRCMPCIAYKWAVMRGWDVIAIDLCMQATWRNCSNGHVGSWPGQFIGHPHGQL